MSDPMGDDPAETIEDDFYEILDRIGELDRWRVTVLLTGISLISSSILGKISAWVLIGYVVYSYTPDLYPEENHDLVSEDVFRFLTMLSTLYFGVITWGVFVPPAIPLVDSFTSNQATVEGLTAVLNRFFIGVVAGGLLYWLYFIWYHGDNILEPDNMAFNLAQEFFYNSEAQRQDQRASVPDRFQKLWRMGEIGLFAVFNTMFTSLLGLSGIFLILFSPLPELALFIGLILNWFFPQEVGKRVRKRLSSVDDRLFKSFDAGQINMKGAHLLLASSLGAVLSAAMFLASSRILVQLGLEITRTIPVESDLTPFLILAAVVTTGVAFLTMGIYSFFFTGSVSLNVLGHMLLLGRTARLVPKAPMLILIKT